MHFAPVADAQCTDRRLNNLQRRSSGAGSHTRCIFEQGQAGFAVIFDFALDGREELRYARTHPLIERFIRDYFRPIDQEGTPAHLHLYARGNSAEKCP
jgi:hypothetical protein